MRRNGRFIKAWLRALRSGKYRQAHGQLREIIATPDPERFKTGYCCLGVACEIGGRFEWEKGKETAMVFVSRFDATYPHSARLPGPALDWVGLMGCEQAELIEMNDHGCGFFEIADALERMIWGEKGAQIKGHSRWPRGVIACADCGDKRSALLAAPISDSEFEMEEEARKAAGRRPLGWYGFSDGWLDEMGYEDGFCRRCVGGREHKAFQMEGFAAGDYPENPLR